MKRASVVATGVTLALLAQARPASASLIPAFARKYGMSCLVCHAPVPRLNATGLAFAANGFEFRPGEEPRDTIATGDPLLRLMRSVPLAVRFDAYLDARTKKNETPSSVDLQTPWVIKLLSGGQVADRISYYMYFLLTERGSVGGLEDAYLQFTDIGGSGVSAIVGQFQMSDPLYKRELRLEYEDYQPYRLRVGDARPDLTYERGIMALYSPWTGGDLAFQLVSGAGLSAATADRRYDRDTPKNVALRFSQAAGPLRLGFYGYVGSDHADGVGDRIGIWGPDATLRLGAGGELNLQFLRRTDSDPFFGACSVATPCPGGAARPFRSTVDAAFAELVIWPCGPAGRYYITGLWNWMDATHPVISLRLGEEERPPGFLTRYQTLSAGVHYVLRRNLRLMGEAGWDVERERASLTTGLVTAF